MFSRLLLLFILVPLFELALLIEIGRQIGVGATLALVILTGIAGAALTRAQGFAVLSQIQSELRREQLPAESLFDGFLVLAGGLLLLTPGIATDLIGFMLLVPVSRNRIKEYLKRKIREKIDRGEIHSSYWVR